MGALPANAHRPLFEGDRNRRRDSGYNIRAVSIVLWISCVVIPDKRKKERHQKYQPAQPVRWYESLVSTDREVAIDERIAASPYHWSGKARDSPSDRRQPISTAKPPLAAQPSEGNVKTAMANTNSQ